MTTSLFTRIVLLVCLSLGITACGGGGGGGGAAAVATTPTPAPVADNTGVVAIVLKDAPTNEFDEILVTISSVTLLGNGDPVVIFDEEKTIDLLKLQNFYDMLAVSDEVPAGTYEKIRLMVTDIDLIKYDDDDNAEVIDAEIPANGKIDLNPRGSFTVAPDTALLIEIDMDAKKSIHVVGTGSERYKFRPVVFVDIQERQLLNGLVRAHGTIGEIAEDNTSLELCDVDIQFTTSSKECVIVNLSEESTLFDENGDAIEVEDIRNETAPVEATVYGIAVVVSDPDSGDSDSESDSDSDSDTDSDSSSDSDSGSDSDSDSDSDGSDTVRMVQIDAIVLQLGPDSAAQQLDGDILTDIDERNLFEFGIDPGQGFTEDSTITTLLQPTTVILSPELIELDRDAIVAGAQASIAGVLDLEGDPLYKSTLIIVDELEELDDSVTGTVLPIEVGDEIFLLRTAETGDLCIDPNDDARFFYFENEEGVIQERGIADMADRQQAGELDATVFGEQIEGEACFRGDLIFYYRPDEDDAP
jgi:hypothetical protein